jgi:acyl-CoA synthetase (AMP-forming)/AMP-acid ligase II
MFKVRGATVYPSEVEAALNALATVERSHVVDIGDAGWGVVAAAVILADGGAPTPTDLERELRTRLSSFKIPTHWKIIDRDAVPMTATGKIDRQALRALLGHGAPESDW